MNKIDYAQKTALLYPTTGKHKTNNFQNQLS
jgi:hypothetical protein